MPLTQALRYRVTRGLVHVGKRSRRFIDRIMAASSIIDNTDVFDNDDFQWTSMLEENWQDIRAEMQVILRHRQAVPPLRDISPDHKRIAGDDRWQSYFMWGYGIKSEANTARCPKTSALLEKIPGLKTALFSILAPGAVIPRHRGVTKALVACHLGLQIPKNRKACRLWINGKVLHWTEGTSFVFDDTYPHDVRNDTDEERVVLLLQVERPLRQPGRSLARLFLAAIRISPFITDAQKALGKWDKKYRNAERKD